MWPSIGSLRVSINDVVFDIEFSQNSTKLSKSTGLAALYADAPDDLAWRLPPCDDDLDLPGA